MKPVTLDDEPKHRHVKAQEDQPQNIIENPEEELIEEQNENNIIEEQQAGGIANFAIRELPTREKSWKNYRLHHQLPMQQIPRGKQAEYLAKSMTGAIMEERVKRHLSNTNFDLDMARHGAGLLMKTPAFKHLMKDPARMNALMNKSGAELAEQGILLQNPFLAARNKQREVLQNLKELGRRMDSAEHRSTKWRNLKAALRDIDLDSPDTYEAQLQKIYDKNEAYMKGKKSVRSAEDQRQRFNQSLDVLGELGKVGTYAKDACEALFDRTNEVRRGHDRNHVDLSINNFGLQAVSRHKNNTLQQGQNPENPQAGV